MYQLFNKGLLHSLNNVTQGFVHFLNNVSNALFLIFKDFFFTEQYQMSYTYHRYPWGWITLQNYSWNFIFLLNNRNFICLGIVTFIITLISNTLSYYVLQLLSLFLFNCACNFMLLIMFLYIKHFNDVNIFILGNLTILFHYPSFIVRFGFLLIYTVISIPFLIYNFYFLILYFWGIYYLFKLLNYYDHCTPEEPDAERDSMREANRTDWERLDWYSKIYYHLVHFSENLDDLSLITVINSVALNLIDFLEFIYNLYQQGFINYIRNYVSPNRADYIRIHSPFYIFILYSLKVLGLNAITQIIISCLLLIYPLSFTRWIIFCIEFICTFLYNFPWNFYLTLRNNVEGRLVSGEGFVMYGFTACIVLEYDFDPTPIEPVLESNDGYETIVSTDIRGSGFVMIGYVLSNIKPSLNVELSGQYNFGRTSQVVSESNFVMSGVSDFSSSNSLRPYSQVRNMSYSSHTFERSSLQVTTTTKNNWTIITYYMNSGSIILSTQLFKPLVKEFLSNLSPDNTAFIVKVEYHDGSTRSLMPMQIINSNFGADEIIGIIDLHLNLKAEWYKLNAVHNVILMYKATSDIVRLTRTLDTSPSSTDSINDLQYLPFIPRSYDLSTWGNVIYSDEISPIIESFDKVYQYTVTVTPAGCSVNVSIKVTTKASRHTSYKFVAMFTMRSLDSLNLTHTRVVLYLHNMKYTFELNNGSLVKGEIPYNLKFMQRLYPMAEGESWNSNIVMTFDLETRTINNVLTPYAIGFYDGELSTSFYLSDFESVDHMILTALSSIIVEQYNGRYLYAHNLSGFDSIFIIKYLVQLAHNNELHPIMRQGKLISLDFNFVVDVEGQSEPQLCSIHFLDSINLMNSSLRKLGKSFNVPIQKDIFPYRFSDIAPLDYTGAVPEYSYFEIGNPKDDSYFPIEKYQSYVQRFDNNWSMRNVCIQYMIDDCISLYQILQAYGDLICNDYRVDITTTPTAPSLSMKIFRTRFIKSTKIGLIDGQLYNILKQGYYGGIVDAYIPYGENLEYNDVNSLYPHGIKPPMPVGNPVHVIGNISLDNFFGIIKAHIVCPEHLDVPVLPVKSNGRLIAATGEWTGWYVSEELRDVRDNSGYTVTPIEGYRFEREEIFPEYVDHFYDLKALSKGNKDKGIKEDPARYQISKDNLNSLYGRFGMSPILEDTTISPSSYSFSNKIVTDISILSEGVDILTSQTEGHDLNINVAVSAFVTAYSRIHMNQIKRLPGYRIYYGDTDSLVTNKPLPDYIYGEGLGLMKLEFHIKQGLFLGPKLYAVLTPKGVIIKIRGLRARDIKFGFNEMLTLLTGNIITSQTLMFRDISQGLITVREQLFTLIATDTKRVIIRDSLGKYIATKPYRLLNNVLISTAVKVLTSADLVLYNPNQFALVPYSSRILALVIYESQPLALVSYNNQSLSLIIYYAQHLALVSYNSQPLSLIIYSSQPLALVIYSIAPMNLIIYSKHYPFALNLSEGLTSSIFHDILRITYLTRLIFYITELDDLTLALLWVIFSFQLMLYIIYRKD